MTHTFDFDTVVDRTKSSSLKWDRYRGRDIIPLWVADMDFPAPPPVVEALHERISHGVFGYTLAPDELVEEVCAYHLREYRWEISPEWLVWLPGLVTGINVACRAVGADGDDVVTFTPVYPPFLTSPPLCNRGVVKVPLHLSRGRWGWEPAELERSITPRTTHLLLCSPHNPVGRVWTREELLQLGDLAQRHNLVVCSDEIHAGLILDENKEHIPFATLSPELARRTITLQAPSKTFNVPGLGCSFAVISDPSLRRRFLSAMGKIVPHVNTLGYTAALASYRHGKEWQRALLEYLKGNRDLVEGEVATMPGLEVTHVEATYLAWIDTRSAGIKNPGRFFEEAGVGLSDGAEFDSPGFVRLNFGCSRVLLKEALRRMRAALG
ncbi:PatB family C-S lyase [Geomonas sp. RF6]|uniref:MalY/PatB family protein n=1 Tax=Geomonas sp. RF6 TaxID=2897342 RepID=UPI001E3B6105|nr:PatB family C-S lyase [Geomonas sp. RF6]UFS72604.1 PatB family C-S lyase [Geomonas sp. RF6]